jgi:hypothetical protein
MRVCDGRHQHHRHQEGRRTFLVMIPSFTHASTGIDMDDRKDVVGEFPIRGLICFLIKNDESGVIELEDKLQ